jgi:hypothetical protein
MSAFSGRKHLVRSKHSHRPCRFTPFLIPGLHRTPGILEIPGDFFFVVDMTKSLAARHRRTRMVAVEEEEEEASSLGNWCSSIGLKAVSEMDQRDSLLKPRCVELL